VAGHGGGTEGSVLPLGPRRILVECSPRQLMTWSAGGRRTLRAQAALRTSRAQGGPPTIRIPGATWPLYLSCRVASTKATFHQHLEFASRKPCEQRIARVVNHWSEHRDPGATPAPTSAAASFAYLRNRGSAVLRDTNAPPPPPPPLTATPSPLSHRELRIDKRQGLAR
jgi:hypothetical protein